MPSQFRAIVQRLKLPKSRRRDKRLELGAWRDDLYFPEWRMGFITVPKAANTSLKYSLVENLPMETRKPILTKIEIAGDRQTIHRVMHQTSYRCSLERLTASDVEHLLTTVRHPEGRLISFYFDKIVGKGWPPKKKAEIAALYDIDADNSFDAFVSRVADIPDEESEIHFRSQYDLIGPEFASDPRLRLIHTENFEKDFKRAIEQIGLKIDTPRKENPTSRPEFQISPLTRRLIERRFAKDYELFY